MLYEYCIYEPRWKLKPSLMYLEYFYGVLGILVLSSLSLQSPGLRNDSVDL